jgi:hypothetical protein
MLWAFPLTCACRPSGAATPSTPTNPAPAATVAPAATAGAPVLEPAPAQQASTAEPVPAPENAGEVSGRLEPKVIQDAVRAHYDTFRKCYEQGLGRNANLQGRVSARFVIGRDGSVTNVSNGGSDLPDDAVVSCVLRSFYLIRFPPPDGGIVTVVYPVMLEPG